MLAKKTLRWHWLIAPALLLIIAGRQIYLSQSHHLSPWSGGGFGMFSSLDAGPERILEINIEYDGQRQRYQSPANLHDLALRTKTLPSVTNLQRFATTLSEQISSPTPRPYTLELSVWRVNYDAVTLTPSEQMITSQRFQLLSNPEASSANFNTP